MGRKAAYPELLQVKVPEGTQAALAARRGPEEDSADQLRRIVCDWIAAHGGPIIKEAANG